MTSSAVLLSIHGWTSTRIHVVVKNTLLRRQTMRVKLHGVVQWVGEHTAVLSVSRRCLAKSRYHSIWYKVSVVETTLI
jgi:hypothetical protein